MVLPKALFNSKALFNPYQYKPFFKVMKKEGEKYVLNKKSILIADEVGVGKTFEVGIILRELLCNNPFLSVLILCPVKLCENWEKELYENFGIGAINYRRSGRTGQITIMPYSYFSSKARFHNLREEAAEEKKLQMDADKTNEDMFEQLTIDLLPYDVLILDEAHYTRNKGKLWGAVEFLEEKNKEKREALRIFLTGTPVFNSQNDFKHIAELLGTDFEHTATLQCEANCYDRLLKICIKEVEVEEGTIENNVIASGQLTGFLKRIAASSFYSLKQFIDDREAREAFKEEWDSDEEELYDAGNLDDIKELLKDWSIEGDIKWEQLHHLLDELKEKDCKAEIENGTETFKVIIFSCFISTCEYLKGQLSSEYHTYMITGRTNVKEVSEVKAAFQNDMEPSVLICSDAAREGHNLQFCHYLIHYDLPYSPAVIGQRNGRIYRRGQKGEPEVYYILMDKGYDLRLFCEIIAEKCCIIKKFENASLVPMLNILPDHAEAYIVKAVEAFVDDYFREETDRAEDGMGVVLAENGMIPAGENELSVAEGNSKNDNVGDSFHKRARSFLRKYFAVYLKEGSGKGTVIWRNKEAEIMCRLVSGELSFGEEKEGDVKELYNLYQSSAPKDRQEFEKKFKEKIEDLYRIMIYSNEDGKLREVFQTQYNNEWAEFNQEVFGDRGGNDPQEYFKSRCREIVMEAGGKKFCHDMLESEMSIEEYKKQFTPWNLIGKKE